MASILSSSTNESQVLHYCIDHPESILDLHKNYFLSADGKVLYDVLLDLYKGHLRPTIENIIGTGNRLRDTIAPPLYKLITSINYDVQGWEHYKFLLREAFAQDKISSELLRDGLTSVTTKGRIDFKKLQTLVYDLQDCINLATGKDAAVKSFSDMFDSYQNVISQRLDGTSFYTTGCKVLDNALPTGFAPGEVTTIFGSTGVGKSTYSLYLINRLVNRRVPCFYVSLEMSETATMDRWMAARMKTPMSHICGKRDPIEEYVAAGIDHERKNLEGLTTFAFLDETSLNVPELERYILQVKLQMKSEYLVVFVDLATMLREFSGGDAREYEHGINQLHQVAKRNDVHIVLVVQALQKQLENHRPSSLQGLDVFRPTLASIKNSGAIAERSRTVLSVFRTKYYATRFFPDNPQTSELDDVMDIQILKSSNGEVGQRLPYIHEEGKFRLFPVPEDYVPTTVENVEQKRFESGAKEVPVRRIR